MIEVMAGRVDVYYAPVVAALAAIRSGQLSALAVSSPQRVSILPDVPTTEELGIETRVINSGSASSPLLRRRPR